MYIPPNAGFSFSEFVSKYKSVTPTAKGVGYQAAQTALNNVLSKVSLDQNINKRINNYLSKTPITDRAGNLTTGWDIVSRVQGIYGVLSGAVTPVAPNMNILNNLINSALDNLIGSGTDNNKSFVSNDQNYDYADYLSDEPESVVNNQNIGHSEKGIVPISSNQGSKYSEKESVLVSNNQSKMQKDQQLFTDIMEELTEYQTESLPFYSRSKSLPTIKLGLYDDSKWLVRMETPKSSLDCGVPYPPYNIPTGVDTKFRYSPTDVNFGTGFVPCTMIGQYELKEGKSEQLQIVDQLGISIPLNLTDKYMLNIEVINDQYNTVFHYMNAYRDALYPDYRTALPYKNGVTIIELWILSRQRYIFQKYRLLGILDCSGIKVTGPIRPSGFTMQLNYDIVGELKEGEELDIYDNKTNIFDEKMNRIEAPFINM